MNLKPESKTDAEILQESLDKYPDKSGKKAKNLQFKIDMYLNMELLFKPFNVEHDGKFFTEING